jgi:hypothetical protein
MMMIAMVERDKTRVAKEEEVSDRTSKMKRRHEFFPNSLLPAAE